MKIEIRNRCSDFNSYRAARVKSLLNPRLLHRACARVSGGVIEFATFLAVSYAGCSPSAGGGSATGSAGASTGSAETTGSCSGAASTAGLGVGSGVGSTLGVV